MSERGDKLFGFLKAMEAAGDKQTGYKPVQTFWVYDGHWVAKGFYTLHGSTFRLVTDPITGRQDFQPLGEHDVDDAKLILLGMKEREIVQLVDMDPPRTLESDAAEAKAKKDAAAAAAKAAEPAAEKKDEPKKDE
jgi:hypothetical protein